LRDLIDAFITLNVRINESEDHIMRYQQFTAARSRLIPLAALVLASALGGCVGYAGYPSRDYGYSQPNYGYSHPNYGHGGYYPGYAVTNTYNQRPYYSPSYSRYNYAY